MEIIYLTWKDIELCYAGKTYSKSYVSKELAPIQDYEEEYL